MCPQTTHERWLLRSPWKGDGEGGGSREPMWQEGGTSQHAGPLQGQWSLPERDRSLVEHSSLSKVLQRPVLSLNWNGIGDYGCSTRHSHWRQPHVTHAHQCIPVRRPGSTAAPGKAHVRPADNSQWHPITTKCSQPHPNPTHLLPKVNDPPV